VKAPCPRIATTISVLAIATGMVGFFSTLASTSAARLAVLRTVEPYALAVQEQLIRNYAATGHWVQTIHAGYDDTWTWSGHHALTLFLTAALYRLHQNALWLTEIQIALIALGAIPAALIGRATLRSGWGLALGGGLYLLHPAVMAIALQDYQDLSLAIPALTFALWAMRSRGRLWPLIGAVVAVTPREECVPLMVACALITWPPGGRRRWMTNIATAVLVAAAYVVLTQWLSPISTAPGPGQGHDTPLVNAIQTVLQARSADDLVGMAHIRTFYSLLWSPVGVLSLLSPLTLAPGAALVLMHMTVPYGNGVDRVWFGHAHHLAPVMPFMVVATIQGAARLLRLVRRWRPRGLVVGPAAAWLAGASLLVWSGWWVAAWGTGFHLVWSALPKDPPYRHPAWILADRLPADAVPVVSVRQAVVVSDRAVAYTWEESLHDKTQGAGLAAATHLIAPKSLSEIVDWALSMDGASIVDQEDGYVTIAWPSGGQDHSGFQRDRRWPQIPDWVPQGYTMDTLPGVPPTPPGGIR